MMYLVLTFIIGCLLTLSMGLEYLALIVLLVYVDALAVLFLFVIMFLDIKASLFHVMSTKPNFSQLGLLVILFLFLLNGIDFNYGIDYTFFAILYRHEQFFKFVVNLSELNNPKKVGIIYQTNRAGSEMSNEEFEAYIKQNPGSVYDLKRKIPFTYIKDNKLISKALFVTAYVWVSSKNSK